MAIRTVALLIILARLSCGVQHRLRKLGDLVELKSAMHPLNGSVFYRVSDPGTIVVVGLHYTKPGPDAFFWAGERRVNGGCNNDNIAPDSYSLHPGQVGNNNYYDIAKPILPAYDGTQKDIILRLPKDYVLLCPIICWQYGLGNVVVVIVANLPRM